LVVKPLLELLNQKDFEHKSGSHYLRHLWQHLVFGLAKIVQAVDNATSSFYLLNFDVVLVNQIGYLVLYLVARQLLLLRLLLCVLVVAKYISFFYLDFQLLIIFCQMPAKSFIKAAIQDLDQFPHSLEVTVLVTIASHAVEDGAYALFQDEIRQGFVWRCFLFDEFFKTCLRFLLYDPLVSLEQLEINADYFRFDLDEVEVKLSQQVYCVCILLDLFVVS